MARQKKYLNEYEKIIHPSISIEKGLRLAYHSGWKSSDNIVRCGNRYYNLSLRKGAN